MNSAIHTEQAPAAIGPYSQGVKANHQMLFISGQLPIDPKTGAIDADTMATQTRQSLSNLEKILKAGGAELKDVVKTTVFLQDMGSFAQMNEVYAEFFSDGTFPARSAVEVAKLPKGALVEIEAIAIVSDHS